MVFNHDFTQTFCLLVCFFYQGLFCFVLKDEVKQKVCLRLSTLSKVVIEHHSQLFLVERNLTLFPRLLSLGCTGGLSIRLVGGYLLTGS